MVQKKKNEQTKSMKGGFGLFNLVSNTLEKLITSEENPTTSQKRIALDSKPNKEEDKISQCYYDPVIKQWIINGKPPEEDEASKRNDAKQDPLAPPPMMKPADPKILQKQEISNVPPLAAANPGVDQNVFPGVMPSISVGSQPAKEKVTSFGQISIPSKNLENNTVPTTKKVFQNRYVSNFST